MDDTRLSVPVRLITWNSSSPHDNLPPEQGATPISGAHDGQ